jgi:hypothetical protein
MTTEEAMIFSELLFAYKRLWIKHQESKYLAIHPNADPEAVHEEFFESIEDLFQPLVEALLERQPLQDELRKLVQEIEHLPS